MTGEKCDLVHWRRGHRPGALSIEYGFTRLSKLRHYCPSIIDAGRNVLGSRAGHVPMQGNDVHILATSSLQKPREPVHLKRVSPIAGFCRATNLNVWIESSCGGTHVLSHSD